MCVLDHKRFKSYSNVSLLFDVHLDQVGVLALAAIDHVHEKDHHGVFAADDASTSLLESHKTN